VCLSCSFRNNITSLGHESGAYATVNDLEQAFGSDTTTEIVAYAWLSIAVMNAKWR